MFSSIFSSFSNEGEVLTLSGKFISKKGQPMAKKYGTDYFFQIKDEKGKTYAYPIMIKDKKVAEMVRKNRTKVFTVVAVPTQKKMRVGEVSKYVHVLDIKEASVFSMKSLGVQDGGIQDQGPNAPYYDRSRPSKSSPTFNISDTAANSIIFAAGAALLGSMLIP
jgi:hypothetical protein